MLQLTVEKLDCSNPHCDRWVIFHVLRRESFQAAHQLVECPTVPVRQEFLKWIRYRFHWTAVRLVEVAVYYSNLDILCLSLVMIEAVGYLIEYIVIIRVNAKTRQLTLRLPCWRVK